MAICAFVARKNHPELTGYLRFIFGFFRNSFDSINASIEGHFARS